MLGCAPVRRRPQATARNFINGTFEQSLDVVSKWTWFAQIVIFTQGRLNYLGARALNYIIAVRRSPNIKRSIYGLEDLVEICDGINVWEFIHQSEQKGATEASFRWIMVKYN